MEAPKLNEEAYNKDECGSEAYKPRESRRKQRQNGKKKPCGKERNSDRRLVPDNALEPEKHKPCRIAKPESQVFCVLKKLVDSPQVIDN